PQENPGDSRNCRNSDLLRILPIACPNRRGSGKKRTGAPYSARRSRNRSLGASYWEEELSPAEELKRGLWNHVGLGQHLRSGAHQNLVACEGDRFACHVGVAEEAV